MPDEYDDYQYFEVPDDKIDLVVYDALHASWHNPQCQRNCQEFLRAWYVGMEFTASDIQVVSRALVDYFEAPAEIDDEVYTMRSGPAVIGPTVTKIASTGTPIYTRHSGTTSTTTAPISWDEAKRMKKWEGNRTGRS